MRRFTISSTSMEMPASSCQWEPTANMPSEPGNVPPARPFFSSTTTSRPSSKAWMPAARPVPPAPTTMRSWSSVAVGSPTSSMTLV